MRKFGADTRWRREEGVGERPEKSEQQGAGLDGWTPLMRATERGRTAAVKKLLSKSGINVDAKTAGGDRALEVACDRGHLEVVKLLVGAGASVEAQADDDMGAVEVAAWGGHLHVVKYLVEEAGADERRANSDGITPLMVAVENGDEDTVAYLLGRPRIDLHAKTSDGFTALQLACNRGDLGIVKLLVAAEARVGSQADNKAGAIMAAAWAGQIHVVNYLMESSGPEERLAAVAGLTSLMEVMEDGHAEPSLEGGSCMECMDVDAGTKTVFEYGNHEAMRRSMGEKGTLAPEAVGAVGKAAFQGKLHTVKYLVEETGAEEMGVGADFLSPLMWAADQGHAEVAAYLLSRPRIKIHAISPQGFTALHYACASGHLEVVKLLVAAGARVNPNPDDETSVLGEAASGGHLDVVKYLVEEAGAEAWRANREGNTALLQATTNGSPGVVTYLLGRPGVNPDARTPGGVTPLIMACYVGDMEVAKLLVGAGARVEVRSGDEVGPIEVAERGGHLDMVNFLKKARAEQRRARREAKTKKAPLKAPVDKGQGDMGKERSDKGQGDMVGKPQAGSHLMDEAAAAEPRAGPEMALPTHPRQVPVYTLVMSLVAVALLFMLSKWKRRQRTPPHVTADQDQGRFDVLKSLQALLSRREDKDLQAAGKGAEGAAPGVPEVKGPAEAKKKKGQKGKKKGAVAAAANTPPEQAPTTHHEDDKEASPQAGEEPEEAGLEQALLEGLSCPISFQLMSDPVMADDGHTYQRDAIERWIDKCVADNRPLTSPLTGAPMGKGLKPNLLVRSMGRNLVRSDTQET